MRPAAKTGLASAETAKAHVATPVRVLPALPAPLKLKHAACWTTDEQRPEGAALEGRLRLRLALSIVLGPRPFVGRQLSLRIRWPAVVARRRVTTAAHGAPGATYNTVATAQHSRPAPKLPKPSRIADASSPRDRPRSGRARAGVGARCAFRRVPWVIGNWCAMKIAAMPTTGIP